MQTVGQQLIITAIPALPALVFLVLALFGRLLKENAQYVAILGVTVSLVFSVFALLFVAGIIPGGGAPIEFSKNWIDLGEGGVLPDGGLHRRARGRDARRGVLREPHDPALLRARSWRATSASPGSTPSSTCSPPRCSGSSLAPNFIELYIFWELVGLCSYLLVGHWFEKPSARDAAQKAFIVTRVGDAALFVGIIIFWATTGLDRLHGHLRGRPGRVYRRLAVHGGGHPGLRRRRRQERAVPAARVAAGRDGGPDAGLAP